MVAKWVLLIFLTSSEHGNPAMTSLEFNDKNACTLAVENVSESLKNNREIQHFYMVCLAKDSPIK